MTAMTRALTPQELTDASNACADFNTKRRIDIVRMLAAGFAPHEVATTMGVRVAAVRDVDRRYRASGLDGLRDRRMRALALSADQRALLAQALQGPPPAGAVAWTGASVRRWIAATFDRKVSHRRSRQLLAEAS